MIESGIEITEKKMIGNRGGRGYLNPERGVCEDSFIASNSLPGRGKDYSRSLSC